MFAAVFIYWWVAPYVFVDGPMQQQYKTWANDGCKTWWATLLFINVRALIVKCD